MDTKQVNAGDAHNLQSGYSQALEVRGAERLLFVSGQIPVRPDGTVPESFEEQARQAWANVESQLRAAGMGLGDVIKHTTYLSDRRYRPQNSAIRRQVLGAYEPALTVIIAGIFDEGWLLEIEAIAAG